jgi:hypothetical protein
MKKSLHILSAMMLFIGACEEPYNLELDNNPNLLVVDGTIHNLPGPYYVSLRYTTSYSFSDSSDYSLPATGAKVAISDDQGNIAVLTEWQPGVYRTDSMSTFRGVEGRSYSLEIITDDDQHFTSKPERLLPPVKIDSLYFIYGQTEPEGFASYRVFIDYTDPTGKGNNYRWFTYLDNFPVIQADVDNDQLVDGRKIAGRQLVGLQTFQRGLDTLHVVVRQASLTSEAFDYWDTFGEQVDSQDNSPYDIPLAPLVGNVHKADDPEDYTLGYFNVLGMAEKSIVLRKGG